MTNTLRLTFVLPIFLFFSALFAHAQDSYHSNLQNELQSSFALPAGTWVLNNTEAANLTSDFSYGNVVLSDGDAMGQSFSKKVGLNVSLVNGPQYNTGYGINSVAAINSGDRCLVVFWMRSQNGEGKASISVQDAVNFTNERYLTFPVVDSWNRYMVPVEISNDYAGGGLQFAFHLNWMDQNLELGGLAVLNYGSLALDNLPVEINNKFYDGYESNAPWRAAAEQRIEQIRKADLNLQVVDGNGMPIQNTTVDIAMKEHAFGFGTAVAAHLFAGNNQQNNTYENRLLDLDGEGHRFNCVVFENATKWRAWEENWWGINKQDKVNTTNWLVDKGFKVRGHTLIWPSWVNLPADIQNNQNDPGYVKNRVLNHIENILEYPGWKGKFSDWDVLNEISVLNDLANTMQGAPGYPTGREIYVDIFNKYKEIEPNGVGYLNDYTVFGGGSSAQATADLKTYTQEIQDAGVQIEGIGFQGHIGTFPTGIPRIYDILEDFHTTFGTAAKITEFDMDDLVDDDLAADYLTDFYTINFSHRSVDAILMWGFWDGAHWFDNAPMFRNDWSLKPAGQAFLDLVFDKWWTKENGQTNAEGEYNVRGFKGTYAITVDCDGNSYTQTLNLHADTLLTIDCSMLVSTNNLEKKNALKVFPNPTSGQITAQWTWPGTATLRVLDLLGREQYVQKVNNQSAQLNVDLPEWYVLVGGKYRSASTATAPGC